MTSGDYKRQRLSIACLAVLMLPTVVHSQLSYQQSRPLRLTSPTSPKQSGAEQPTTAIRPRFLGWKHNVGSKESFARCGPACLPSAPTSVENAVRPFAQRMSSTPPPLSSFALRPTLPAGAIPTSVAIGDFNGDGKLDWAVSNGADSSVWIYLGKGDGTSNLPTIISLTGLGPTWLTAADLRGNGTLDLIVAEADSGTVGVLLGNGDGTFQPEVEYTPPSDPLFILAGDFNGDGKLDIAVGMFGSVATGPVAVLPGDGLGHLEAALYVAADSPSIGAWLASADVNGDGKLDLVVVDPYDGLPHGGAQIYLNNGNGTFAAGQVVFSNTTGIGLVPGDSVFSAVLSDVNGDGCADAVITDSFGLAYIFTGTCQGGFSTSPFSRAAIGDIAGTIQLVDMNHDGKPDIVTSGIELSGAGGVDFGNVAGNLVSVLLGDGTGHFAPGGVYRGEPTMYGLAVGDLNGDGFPDVVTANEGSNSASVYINDGKGGFGDPQGEPIGYSVGVTNAPDSPFLFADVDGNGTTDIFLLELQNTNQSAEQITTILNDGTGKFSTPIQSNAWASGIYQQDFALADFRNTGQLDLLVTGLTNSYYFAPNVGGGKFGPGTVSSGAPGGCCLLAVGDFNHDGKLDFVTLSESDLTNLPYQQLNVYLGNGDGTFSNGQSIPFGDDTTGDTGAAVYVGDFNRDGKLDILALTGNVYEFLGNGDGTFQAPKELFLNFGGFVLADVNRDGWPDMIALTDPAGNTTTFMPTIPTISVFLGQADGTFKYSQTYTPYLDTLLPPYVFGGKFGAGPFDAVLGDFNGDGNPDVAIFQLPWVAQSDTWVQVLYGNGDGTFTPDYISYAFNKSSVPQFAADLNGDGLSDLIESDGYTASFNVIKSSLSAPALQIEMLTNPVNGGTGYGRVILNLTATTATTVTLTSSDSNIVAPTMTIPAGETSQDFQFSIGSGFDPQNVFSIQAQLGTSTAIAYGYVSSVPAPVIELTPTALLFGDLNFGSTSAPQNVTVKNLGSAPLTFSEINGGTGEVTNNCGTTLVVGSTCTIQVVTRSQTGGVTIFDNAGNGSQQVPGEAFFLQLQVSCCLTFITAPGTTSAAQIAMVTNQETRPLQITVAQPSPNADEFAETNNCGTLAPGASCQITVTFKPSQSGTLTSTIMVSDNFGDASGISLTGNGIDFALNVIGGSGVVNAGQTAIYQMYAQSLYDFAGSVSLSCSGAPQGATCTVNPTSVNLTFGEESDFTVTLTTTARSSSVLDLPSGRKSPSTRFFLTLTGSFLASCFIRRRGRRIRTTVLFLVLSMCSCGGGTNSNSGSGGNPNTGPSGGGTTTGTPAGSYTVSINGSSGSISHSFQLSLTVN